MMIRETAAATIRIDLRDRTEDVLGRRLGRRVPGRHPEQLTGGD